MAKSELQDFSISSIGITEYLIRNTNGSVNSFPANKQYFTSGYRINWTLEKDMEYSDISNLGHVSYCASLTNPTIAQKLILFEFINRWTSFQP